MLTLYAITLTLAAFAIGYWSRRCMDKYLFKAAKKLQWLPLPSYLNLSKKSAANDERCCSGDHWQQRMEDRLLYQLLRAGKYEPAAWYLRHYATVVSSEFISQFAVAMRYRSVQQQCHWLDLLHYTLHLPRANDPVYAKELLMLVYPFSQSNSPRVRQHCRALLNTANRNASLDRTHGEFLP